MNQCFEMRVVGRPKSLWEVILMMANSNGAVPCFLSRIAYLAVNEEDFLMDLDQVSMIQMLIFLGRTQELSEMERIRGAKAEVGSLGVDPPLIDGVVRPYRAESVVVAPQPMNTNIPRHSVYWATDLKRSAFGEVECFHLQIFDSRGSERRYEVER